MGAGVYIRMYTRKICNTQCNLYQEKFNTNIIVKRVQHARYVFQLLESNRILKIPILTY